VLVVDGENTAQQRYVTPGALDGGLRAVKDGLKPEDRVIVNGMMRARPGAKVTPEEQAQADAKTSVTK
jgi:multidrug efflux system membrane fusion protein